MRAETMLLTDFDIEPIPVNEFLLYGQRWFESFNF